MNGQITGGMRAIIDRVYPVGVIIDFAVESDPNTSIGCGTVWQRIAEDPVTGEIVQVPADMTYGDWKRLNEQHYGKERVDAARKMVQNKAADRKQYDKYKAVLGAENVPETFAKFQEIKYNNIKEWDEQKAQYRDVNWQVKAQEKLQKGTERKVPNTGEPNSRIQGRREAVKRIVEGF